MKEGLGRCRSWLCGYEREVIEDFIFDTFAREPEFASDVIGLADWHLEKAPSDASDMSYTAFEGDPDGGHAVVRESDSDADARAYWKLMRMVAMATRGDSGDALCAYAKENELLLYTEALNLIADAYEVEGLQRKAIALLREHAGAVDMIQPNEQESCSTWLVSRMLGLAWRYYSREELIKLYYELLLDEAYVANDFWYERDSWRDVARWYDEMHGLVGEPEWVGMRKKLLKLASDYRKQIFRRRERDIREFGKRMIAFMGDEFPEHTQYKASCPEMGPLYPAAYYLRYAELYARKANTFKDYREVATALGCAARLCSQYKLAQKAAAEIATEHSRKRTLLKELRQEGFDV